MTDNAALVWHQLRFDLLVFWRSPASVFFTVLLPIIFLFIFQGLFGDERIPELGMKVSTYYVPGILTLAIVSATTQSLAMNLTVDRESGRLKRVRATPLPAVGVRGRQGRQLVRHLRADGRGRDRDRRDLLRRRSSPRTPSPRSWSRCS